MSPSYVNTSLGTPILYMTNSSSCYSSRQLLVALLCKETGESFGIASLQWYRAVLFKIRHYCSCCYCKGVPFQNSSWTVAQVASLNAAFNNSSRKKISLTKQRKRLFFCMCVPVWGRFNEDKDCWSQKVVVGGKWVKPGDTIWGLRTKDLQE